MAFPTTYNGWLTYIRDWLAADEYSEAQIASFLDLAQLRLNREMESYGMEADTQIVVASAAPIVITSVVADFNKVRLVSVPSVGPLDVLSINEIKKLLEENPGTEGTQVKNYCIDAGKLYTYPVMSADTIDFFYYKKIPALSKTPPVDSNVFTVDHPDAMLYACLLAAAPYMNDDEKAEIWSASYLAALSTANSVSNHIKKGSTPLKREIKIS